MKDEKIIVLVAKDPCKECSWKGNGTCCGCPEQREYKSGLTYSEAIDKMAIAILVADTPDNKENDVLIKLKLNDTKMLKICKIYAEAALKALQEVKE